MKPKVLITGARAAVAIDLARDFTAAGYEVHMADSSSAFISRWSGAPQHVHRYAAPTADLAAFRSDIRRIAEAIDPAIIIPTCEEVFYLPSAFTEGPFADRLFAPDFQALQLLHNKYSFAKFCADIGLNVPETHKIHEIQGLTPYVATSEDWVFKPCYTRFGAEALVGPDVKQLQALSFGAHSSWVAQKRIRGQELSFYAVAKAGRLVAISVYTSSWRLRRGASYAFEPVTPALFVKVREMAAKLAAALTLTGQFSCDLICGIEGVPWLIECNPRATSGLHLLQNQLAPVIAGSGTALEPLAGGGRYMLPMMLSYGLRDAVLKGTLKDWYETLRTGTDVIGAARDRLPVLGAFADTAIFMLRGMRRGISLAQATTADIEWNGEALT